MNVEHIRDHILSLPFVTEDMPFGDGVLVFRVGNKMFALCGLDNDPLTINLKCDPELAVQLRIDYSCVNPGYHMNKQHWNTITIADDCTWSLLETWIQQSYDIIFASLPKKVKESLSND